MAILALEASTSSVKAMLFDRVQNDVIAVASRNYPREICDIKTMDLAGVAAETLRLGKDLLAGRTDIELIALCSIWYHSAALFDKAINPIGRLKTWADTSCAEAVEDFRKDPALYERIYLKTGNPPHSVYALYKWLQLCRDIKARTQDIGAFMALPDYLFYRFTGKRMVSVMTASASGLLNIRSLQWDGWLMDAVGISAGQLSALAEPEHVEPLSREAAAGLGLPAGLPVLVTGGDGACNQIAVGGLRPGILSMSVGTSGAIRQSGSAPLLRAGPLKNWCYYGAEKRWINGAATNGAGSCVDWFLREVCGGSASIQALDRELLKRYKGPMKAPVFLPFQFGERCPGWNDTRKGGWWEPALSNERHALYYSVLEGVLFNLYQCYGLLCPPGNAPERILLSGGIVRSAVWVQMAADIFGAPMELTDVEHASILGAVRIGQKALGDIKSLSGISCCPVRVVMPRSPGMYKERLEKYMHWYERTK